MGEDLNDYGGIDLAEIVVRHFIDELEALDDN
jgi:hypothetical protein